MYVNKLIICLALLIIVSQGLALRSRARQVKLLLHAYFEMSDWVRALCGRMEELARRNPEENFLEEEFARDNGATWGRVIRENHARFRAAGVPPTTDDDVGMVISLKSRHGVPFE